MNVRKFLFFLAMAALLLWGTCSAYQHRWWFVLNRAQYEMNRGNFAEASRLAESVDTINQRYFHRTDNLRFDARLQLAAERNAVAMDSPLLPIGLTLEGAYLRGLSWFEHNAEKAAEYFSRFGAETGSYDFARLDLGVLANAYYQGNDDLLIANRFLATYVCGEPVMGLRLPADERVASFLSGYRALLLFDFSGAKRMFATHGAYVRDRRLRGTMAAAAALDGDYTSCLYYLVESRSEDADSASVEGMRAALRHVRSRSEQSVVEVGDSSQVAEIRKAVDEALIWIDCYTAHNDSQQLGRLPLTAMLPLRLHEYDDASSETELLQMAQSVADETGSLEAQLLAADLRGDGLEVVLSDWCTTATQGGAAVFDFESVPESGEWSPVQMPLDTGELSPEQEARIVNNLFRGIVADDNTVWETEIPDMSGGNSYQLIVVGKPLVSGSNRMIPLQVVAQVNGYEHVLGSLYFATPFVSAKSLRVVLPQQADSMKLRFRQTQNRSWLYLNKIIVERTEDVL